MNILVQRIINKPVDSNSYVIYKQNIKNCIVVDPGTENCTILLDFLYSNNLIPEYIILTHEHFDHIWGVNKLKDIFKSKIVCSKDCSKKIIDKKKNMSVFYNQIGFETYPADILIEDINYVLSFNNYIINFIKTPGHTNSSICINIDKKLFTGDTIIKGLKTVIKLPGGNKKKLLESLNEIFTKFYNQDIKLYPGHGDVCFINEIKIEKLI